MKTFRGRCQGWGRGFESLRPLQISMASPPGWHPTGEPLLRNWHAAPPAELARSIGATRDWNMQSRAASGHTHRRAPSGGCGDVSKRAIQQHRQRRPVAGLAPSRQRSVADRLATYASSEPRHLPAFQVSPTTAGRKTAFVAICAFTRHLPPALLKYRRVELGFDFTFTKAAALPSWRRAWANLGMRRPLP